jgi:hypothetical protein
MSSQIAAKLVRSCGRRAPLAPPADVDAADVANRADGSLDPDDEPSEVGGEVVREVRQVHVFPCLEDDDDGQPERLVTRDDAPALVAPESRAVAALAAPAGARPGFAAARRLVRGRL